MRNIKAVFIKQMLSYFKNPTRWGAPAAFLLIPFMLLTLSPGSGEHRVQFTTQFLTMFVGIAMIGNSSGFIVEDKSTMNLRFMSMAGVKPYQYLIATCGVLLVVSLGVLILFGLIAGHSGEIMLNFLILSMLGAATSMLLGITLGLSKVAPFSLVVAILLGGGPAWATDFGMEVLSRIMYLTFTYQVNTALRGDLTMLPMGAIQIVLINMAVILAAFVIMNIRTGLDGERLEKAGG